jgi:tyrosyl-tRNA synthetase
MENRKQTPVKRPAEKLFGGEIDINDTNIPEIAVLDYITDGELDMVSLLSETGILKSKREAREFIDTGSVSIGEGGNEKIITYTLLRDSLNLPTLLRVGKKRYYKLV